MAPSPDSSISTAGSTRKLPLPLPWPPPSISRLLFTARPSSHECPSPAQTMVSRVTAKHVHPQPVVLMQSAFVVEQTDTTEENTDFFPTDINGSTQRKGIIYSLLIKWNLITCGLGHGKPNLRPVPCGSTGETDLASLSSSNRVS